MDINQIPPDERPVFVEQYVNYAHDLIEMMESDDVLYDAITKWNEEMVMKYQVAFINYAQSQSLREELSEDIDQLKEGEE